MCLVCNCSTQKLQCPRCNTITPFAHHFSVKGNDEKAHYVCAKCGKKWWRKYIK